MFSTRSSVSQLKPSTILECVQEAEEHRWTLGDVAELVLGSHDQQETDPHDLGSMLLGQSSSLKKIHSYFSQLESRKCCLYLASQRSTFNSMRVVPSSKTIDDGSAKSIEPTSDVKFLENKDLRAFKHAYLCAVYPVLAAPDPPSPVSPSPVIHEGSSTSSFLQRTASFTSSGGVSSAVPYQSFVPLSSSAPSSRPLTPYSLYDSGVEESDEAGLIPMESICEQLQRAFRLSNNVFQQYEDLIIKTYSKKSSQRLLAEELSGQLAVLETNSHPFYSPKHFITQNGYDLWQKQERTHISELLNKFWSSSLPYPRDNQDLISELHSVHEDYYILLKKLLLYESRFRQVSDELTAGTTFAPMSSASYRLLLEFGLRYGIGELYRKILLLQCLIAEFSPAAGYLAFMNNLVVTIHQMLPSNKMTVVMIKPEFDMLYSSLRVLKVQACKALSQMKTLFPANKPAEGIELLLILLKSVLGLMSYLATANMPHEKFDACLKDTVQSIFMPTYEMFKSVAQEDLSRRREGDLDPRTLNILIQDIREDVNDYKTNFESTFDKYFSISKMAATSFYQFLMKDVESLSQSDLQNRPLVEINQRMLALAYRLNTLDSDWAAYVKPQEQTWRLSFLPTMTQWTIALRSCLQNLVLDAVAGDAYVSQKLELPQPVLTYQTAVTPSDSRSISFSMVSLSPSINSAFNSIISSVNSTPHPDCILESAEVPENSDACEDVEILNFGLTEYEMRPGTHKSKSSYDTRSLNQKDNDDKPLHFSAFRRFSLPVSLDEAKSNKQFSINQQCSNSDICLKGTTQHQIDIRRLCRDRHSPNLHSEEISNQKASTPVHVITPGSSFSDFSEHDKHAPSDSYESEDEEFTFPPLKIVSQQTLSNSSPSDFSKPVFSMSKSCEHDQPRVSTIPRRNILHRSNANHSTSSSSSSIMPDVAEDECETTETDVVLFPHPSDVTKAVMPISGSVVDIMIMLQRLCCFSNNLINVMLSESPFTSRQSSFQALRQFSSISTDNNQISMDSAGSFPSYERNVSTSSFRSTNSLFNRLRMPTDGDKDFVPVNVSTPDESNSLHQSFSQISEVDTDTSELSPLKKHKIKLTLHLKMLKAVCNTFVVYTSNMLFMDLCSTPRAVAKRLIGPKLVEFIESQQTGKLIWGCRHQAEANFDCLLYYNRKTKLLSDRHEQVTQHMCTRINNVFACLHILEAYQKKLLKAFNIPEDEDYFLHARNVYQEGTGRRNSTVSQDYVYVSHPSVQDDNVMEDNVSLDLSSSVEDIMGCWSYQSKQIVDLTRQHIMGALTGMYRLLSYKLNLFIKDGLYILLHQKRPNVSIANTIAPVTIFLQKYLDSLSTWLYHDCFRRVLENLWVLIVQGIESHADELRKSETVASTSLAHNWMLTVSHLIKFMNNNGRGIKKDLLLAQANDVIFRLQLYTLSTSHLIALFESLRDYYIEGDHLTLEENAGRNPPAIIHRIHNELQSLRKSFSGAELVHWIMKNRDALPADLSLPSELLTKESAVIISQILLDQQFIVEVDSECPTSSPTPISFAAIGESSPYPNIIIHSQGNVETSNEQRNGDSYSSDSTLENMQIVQADMGQGGHDSTNSSSRSTPHIGQQPQIYTPVQNGHDQVVHTKSNEETDGNDIQSQKDGSNLKTVDASKLDSRMPVTNNAATRARNIYLRENGSHLYEHRRRNTDSYSEDGFYSEKEKSVTPFSLLTEVTFSNTNKKFMSSSKKFYCIHQSVLHQASTTASGNTFQTESEHYFTD